MAASLDLVDRTSPPSEPGVPLEAITVVLADDHALVRRSLRRLLEDEPEVTVVAEAGELASAGQEVGGCHPQVLVLDLHMRGGASIEAIRSLSDRSPHTSIVIVTMEDSPVFAQRALGAGALGFVSKDLADEELPQAVRAAARGEQYLSPRVAARLEALQQALTDNKLTQREVEVLRLIALGHTSVEIARQLHLSPRTIETHRAHIHRKLGLVTRAELVRYALRRGLVGA
jgi:two-component system response regulator NreC